MNILLLNVALSLITGVIILWTATLVMRETMRIRPLLPLLILGLSTCMLAAIYFSELLLTVWHFAFTLIFILAHCLIGYAYFRSLDTSKDS